MPRAVGRCSIDATVVHPVLGEPCDRLLARLPCSHSMRRVFAYSRLHLAPLADGPRTLLMVRSVIHAACGRARRSRAD